MNAPTPRTKAKNYICIYFFVNFSDNICAFQKFTNSLSNLRIGNFAHRMILNFAQKIFTWNKPGFFLPTVCSKTERSEEALLCGVGEVTLKHFNFLILGSLFLQKSIPVAWITIVFCLADKFRILKHRYREKANQWFVFFNV